jgi:hypothetical protein
MKWYLGDRLLEEGQEVLTEEVVSKIGVELRIGRSDLFYCLAFRKKFPRLETLWEQAPEGKNISWHKLVNHYIDFTVPKPEIPVEEMGDKFGLLEWWNEQKDLGMLRLTDKEYPFTLIIKVDKGAKTLLLPHLGDKGTYKELGEYYITLKKWNPEDLNRNDYSRMNRALKELLEKSRYDKEKVKRAIAWCDKQYGTKFEWGLETVVKKFAEAVRPIKEYEKYLKKDYK